MPAKADRDGSSRKRSRAETKEEGKLGGSQTPKHDEEFWFTDGNIVLIAGDVAFRIYRGFLASQSEVFRGMFDAPNTVVDETIADCPVVRMADSPQDLRHLLRMLLPLDGCSPWAPAMQPVPFASVSAVIRLAHKYGIQRLERDGLHILKDFYTDSFAKFDRQGPWVLHAEGFHAIAAVNIARLTDTPSMLPLALYECCALQGAVLDGCLREDGTKEELGVADLRRCIDARDKLSQATVACALVCLDPDELEPEACPRLEACRAALGALRHTYVAGAPVLCAALDPFRDEVRRRCAGLCERCLDTVVECETAQRRLLWRRLPELFKVEVPGWPAR